MNGTPFVKENFYWDGMYLSYYDPKIRFVARFKYNRRDRASFQKFLIANFSVQEYFDALLKSQAPAQILKAKGWVSPTMKRALELANA